MATNLFDLYAKISLDDTEFSSGIDRAMAQGNGLASKIGTVFTGISNVGKKAFTAVGVAATAGGAALGAFVKASVNTGEEFDKSMSQVAATMGYSMEELNEKGSEANKTFEALRNAAIQYGETTAFTSTQASEALNYMALAGYDAETAISTLPAVLNLAAAGGLELGYASDMITDSQTALGLSLEETNVLMDQMAVTASRSNTSVGQLGEAILTVGGTAKYMSGGTKELSSVIGVLADNGIKGSEAGTHLRNMILKLSSPTDAGAAALNRLGVSIFDSEGKMRSFTEIFPELNAAMSNLTEEEKLKALSDIFNVRDIASANALLSTTSDRWEELGGYIEGAGGAMERMAETQLDNLAGDVTILNSALDGLKIAISDKVTPTLRRFAKQGTMYIGRVKKALTDRGWKGALKEVSNILSEMLSAFVEYLPKVANVATEMIIAFIDGISANASGMIAAGSSMLQSILSGFSQIRERIKPIISQFAPLIMEYFLSFKGEMFQIGFDIISSIVTGISNNIGLIVKSAFDIANSIANSIITELPTITMAGLDIISAIVTGISRNAGSLAESAFEITNTLINSISSAIPSLAMSGISIVLTLAESILTNIPSMLVVGAQMIQQIVNNISAYLPGILYQGSVVLGEFIKGISDNLPTLIKTAADIMSTIVEDLGLYIPWLLSQGATILMNLIQGILDSFPSLLSTALDIIQTLIDDILEYAPMLIGAGWLVFNKLVQELPGILKSAADQVIGFIDDLGNQLAEKYPSLSWVFENLETIIGGVVTAIAAFKAAMFVKDVMDKASTGIQSVGKTLMSIFSTIATHPIGAAIAAIAALVAGLIILYNNNEDFRNFVNDAWTKIKNWIITAKDNIVEAWNNLKTNLSSLWAKVLSVKDNIISAWNDIKSKLSDAKDKIVGAWDNIKSKAGELWSKILSVKDNIVGAWDKIKEKATEIKDNITSAFDTLKTNVAEKWNSIKAKIMAPINSVKTWLEDKIEKIKGLFDFDWSFPKPKMPHFKIEGKLDLLTWPPKIPSVSIEWKRKAMNNPQILNGATIFGAMNGRLLGGGEAGPEVVSGANTLMGMIKDAVRETGSGIGQVIINIDGAQYEDADELANVIAEKLQGIVDRRAAAWA